MNFQFEHSPFDNFKTLLETAESLSIKDHNGMFLSTCGKDLKPSVRTVLFKGVVRGGLSFYTNYNSPKSQDLLENSNAAAVFYWSAMDTQVRFEGTVLKLTREESQAYFATRPRLSQIGAWASLQSQELESFEAFQASVEEITERFAYHATIPCPENWGGFHIIPVSVEFWFGQSGRLHKRYCYTRETALDAWQRKLKYP